MSDNEETRQVVVDRLVKQVMEKLPSEEAPLVRNFIKQYYLNVAPEDLSSKNILDLYGAVLSHWHYMAQRQKNEAKVRVYNPQLEQHGWQTTHTVIEIAFDDMPFLVDSVSMELNRLELSIHIIIHMGSIRLRRDAVGRVIEVLDKDKNDSKESWINEAAIYVEIDRQSDPEVLDMIAENLKRVLYDVAAAVYDWPKMRSSSLAIIEELKKNHPAVEETVLQETLAFIEWLVEDHFTFLGFEEYEIKPLEGEGDQAFYQIPTSSLGLSKRMHVMPVLRRFSDLTPEALNLTLSNDLMMLGKTDQRSTIHRPVYTDFVAIKKWDTKGKLIGEYRLLGLYTSVAYYHSPQYIPYLRRKISTILFRAGFIPRSHDDRALLNILETLPRDDLFQAPLDELLSLSTRILHLQERQKIRLFIRKDIFGLFFSCLVYVPRDTYNSQLRGKMQEILVAALQGTEVEFQTRFSESSLARIHYVIRVHPNKNFSYDILEIERKLIEAGRTWRDEFRAALGEHYGEESANILFKRYGAAFPAGYQEAFSARTAVVDIEYLKDLSTERPLAISLYRPLEDSEDTLRFKLFRVGATIPLSDVVPILENMGLRIISERPYEITPYSGASVWINDYRMVHPKGQSFDLEQICAIFQEAFDNIWDGKVENDGFNRLVLAAHLNVREVSILRAYAKYMWQVGFSFSQNYIADVLFTNSYIAADLIQLFKLKFNSDQPVADQELHFQQEKILQALDGVSNLNEDRILRRYLSIILATVRTNYYQKTKDNSFKPYLSFKFDSAKIPELPLPVPLYEIFVYSPRVEAIHLRGAKVARGGIRWSDRREDFRTEVLGLMKAQQVKNAVIVPMGAKGGFVVKQLPENGSRDQIMEEVVYCYQTLISGLLDLTDNLKGAEIIPPPQVVRYDDNDPYLVVAADKGTATFSDIANALAKDYQFWLGDAFASGGSTGYDHKKMAITARGGWESVKRHFHEMGIDIQNNDFTVIGIGDMSGDVFGNGMLLSNRIKLVAAFNHLHIFIDPDPDPTVSFEERKRLFELPRSSWSDYKASLISRGGGVFSRAAKSIVLTPEMKALLQVQANQLVPSELIQAILKAPVDLLWNGGIGTYVKASQENNHEVGDRSNDALRVNGKDLRCKVVGEGGNLGFTQLGRIEYAQQGGRLNTDAIDNSGGVNCSDNEVNIKILLNDVVEHGDLTEKQRNELLAEMQDEVAELVLFNNRRQTEAISVAVSQAIENLEMHSRVIREMERSGELDRTLEFLPSEKEIAERKAERLGLTRPEIAVLMAYSKSSLKHALLASNLPEEPYIAKELALAFPQPVQRRFSQYLEHHRLKREIIVTRISNMVINEMGISFVYRLQDETGALPPDIIRAYTASRIIFEAGTLHTAVTALAGRVEANIQLKMLHEVNRLVRRGSRWFLRNRRAALNIRDTIEHFQGAVAKVSEALPLLLAGSDGEMDTLAKALMEANVPEPLAYRIGGMSAMFSSLDIVEASSTHKFPLEQVAAIYYGVGKRLNLDWFREMIKRQSITNHWEALARASFRDDLDRQQRNLTIGIMHMNNNSYQDVESLINLWVKRNKRFVARWEYFISELKNAATVDFTMFSVALRELLDMSQVTSYKGKS